MILGPVSKQGGDQSSEQPHTQISMTSQTKGLVFVTTSLIAITLNQPKN